jgi:hypothetical protein
VFGLAVGATAQRPDFSAYALNVLTYVDDGPLSTAGFSDFQRLRLMGDWARGAASLELAYEHSWLLRESGVAGAGLFTRGGATSGDWLGLGWRIEESERLQWDHRFDRLAAQVGIGDEAELIVGRQSISWATTLVLTPADPFAPFDPSDPFREYSLGVDAARLRLYPGPFSEIDIVARPADFASGSTMTALVRGRTALGSWDLQAWAGLLHDAAAGALSLSGSVGRWALRAEASVRELDDGAATLRGVLGVDRLFTVARRDLYVIVEYQRDGFGAGSEEELPVVVGSTPFQRGEVQLLGRDEAVLQASYQVHPLLSVEMLTLANLIDRSVLTAPAVSVSATQELTLRGGAFFGAGAGFDARIGSFRSEFGAVPSIGYVAATLFF